LLISLGDKTMTCIAFIAGIEETAKRCLAANLAFDVRQKVAVVEKANTFKTISIGFLSASCESAYQPGKTTSRQGWHDICSVDHQS
jgi:hypothetical protein